MYRRTLCLVPLPRVIPDGSTGVDATVNAVRMLAEMQPCQGVGGGRGALVDHDALGVAGYSLGAGRAIKGAATTMAGAAPSFRSLSYIHLNDIALPILIHSSSIVSNMRGQPLIQAKAALDLFTSD